MAPEAELKETGEYSASYEYLHSFLTNHQHNHGKRVIPRVVLDYLVRYYKILPIIA
jgi:hypothetical protein